MVSGTRCGETRTAARAADACSICAACCRRRTSGDSLATWKEQPLTLRTGADPLNTQAVTLGWNRHVRGDTAKLAMPASYTITLTDSAAHVLGAGPGASLYLSLAATDAKPGPR